jgi:hypothetical protein
MVPFSVLKKREPIQRMAALIAELKADAIKARSEMFEIHMKYRNRAHAKLVDFFKKTYNIPENTDFRLSMDADPTIFRFDQSDAKMWLSFRVQCGGYYVVPTVIDMHRELNTSRMDLSQKILVIIAGGLTEMELLAGKFTGILELARDLVMRMLTLKGTKEASE